jgi:predicted phosphodiesterase
MKIAVCSDLHLEFSPITLENPGADVLVLSGDILIETDLAVYDRRQIEMGIMTKRSVMFHEFMQNCSEKFPHVVYIAGNHEHYHGDFAKTIPELKRKLAYLSNVHILDKEVFKLDDVTFVGGTLWTDMNNEDPLTLYHIKSRMNDFQCVENSSCEARKAKFCPEDAVEDHRKMLQFINVIHEGLSFDDKMVVVGHHAPSRLSTADYYKGDTLMNGGYSSELHEYILDRPKIKLWTHGHTHDVFDYMLGTTRVFCNPRGYDGYEERAEQFELKVVEV